MLICVLEAFLLITLKGFYYSVFISSSLLGWVDGGQMVIAEQTNSGVPNEGLFGVRAVEIKFGASVEVEISFPDVVVMWVSYNKAYFISIFKADKTITEFGVKQ